jgi:starvation-inducible DNA-binding protein
LSRGYVETKSNWPGDMPAINPRYLSEEPDRRANHRRLRIARRIFAAPALQRLVREETRRGCFRVMQLCVNLHGSGTLTNRQLSQRFSMSASRRSGSAALGTPTDLSSANVGAITAALNPLVADAFALYLKTKNFHWHVSGPHFRDYHLLLDEQGDQIFAITDELAARVRKIGGTTLRSIGHVAKLQRISDNDAEFVAPPDMLRELMEDNRAFT